LTKENINKYFTPVTIFYVIGVLLDLLTTFLASPHLKYEDNFLVKDLSFSWNTLVLAGLTGIIINVSLYTNGISYFASKTKRTLLKSIVFSVGITAFYYHLIYSYTIAVNNYLSYIYLNDKPHILLKISKLFIENRTYDFYIYLKIIVFVIALSLYFKKLNKINKKINQQ